VFIFAPRALTIVELALPSGYGSRVAERVIEHASPMYGGAFFDELIANASDIASNRFGNYVIQSFLEHNPRREDCAIALLPHAKSLARTMGWFVLRYSISCCDKDVQNRFGAELASEHDE